LPPRFKYFKAKSNQSRLCSSGLEGASAELSLAFEWSRRGVRTKNAKGNLNLKSKFPTISSQIFKIASIEESRSRSRRRDQESTKSTL
jgi:hypothetical protein